jgi:excisionase family DNA binding protein
MASQLDSEGPAAPSPSPSTSGKSKLVPFESRWDVRDVAAYLKCSRSWVYKAAEKGWLPCERYGGLLRFDPDAIRAWVWPETQD